MANWNPKQVEKYREWKEKHIDDLRMLHEDHSSNMKPNFNQFCKEFFMETRWFRRLQGVK